MKKTRFEQMQEQMARNVDPEQAKRVTEAMAKEYKALCEAYADRPKEMVNHTHNNIFPVVAAFRVLLAEGMSRPQAAELAQNTFLELMKVPEQTIRKALKIPGLYHLMPWLWKVMMPRMFSEAAGFQFRVYSTDRNRVKIDMFQCPYYRICQELDCIEIAPTFCTADDICYGNMHPKLIWNRTKTLVRGGDVCDFDLYIKK